MPRGIYRGSDDQVMVDYGTYRTFIPRYRYEINHYQPPYDQLPTQHALKARNVKES